MAHAQQRQPGNGVAYFLTYKRVKNINLRIGPDGEAHASAPFGVPAAQVDAFVLSKAAWLERAKARAARRRAEDSAPCAVTPAQALALFEAVSAQVFPCFSGVLGGVRPTLKARRMKTRWGVCMPGKRQITLNLRLAEKPLAAVEYVVVHEYAHFVHCDHSPAFWAVVARILPDYKARRALLRA